MTFEYQLKSVDELVKIADIDFSLLKALPFQAQIHYTALDGSKQVRVITQRLEISNDKEELIKNADFEIFGINAQQKATNFARKGDYRQA